MPKKTTKNGQAKSTKNSKETPEKTIDNLLSGYFSDAKEEAKKDFSLKGIRGMLTLQAGLFVYEQMKAPDEKPPWFAGLVFNFFFPLEQRKINITEEGEGTASTEEISLYSFIPRPGDSDSKELLDVPRKVDTGKKEGEERR